MCVSVIIFVFLITFTLPGCLCVCVCMGHRVYVRVCVGSGETNLKIQYNEIYLIV